MGSLQKKRLIFVSHAGEDTWVARQIAREITLTGAEVFLDAADIEIGAVFEEDIRAFLEKADELLVLFTPWSLDRPYVWLEIGAALIRDIPVIVVLHGLSKRRFQSRPTVPIFVKKRNLTSLNDIDRYFLELKKRLEKEDSDGE